MTLSKKDDEMTLEEEATELLRQDAKDHHTTLYREGIIDERRRRLISQREIPMSSPNLKDT
jgi:hypothetical protein